MTVNKEGQEGKTPKKNKRMYLKWAVFNLSMLLITLNNPGNSDYEDLESHSLKKMFKWECKTVPQLFYICVREAMPVLWRKKKSIKNLSSCSLLCFKWAKAATENQSWVWKPFLYLLKGWQHSHSWELNGKLFLCCCYMVAMVMPALTFQAFMSQKITTET